jgi:hypothetical protein
MKRQGYECVEIYLHSPIRLYGMVLSYVQDVFREWYLVKPKANFISTTTTTIIIITIIIIIIIIIITTTTTTTTTTIICPCVFDYTSLRFSRFSHWRTGDN